jgi:hypothetical protein
MAGVFTVYNVTGRRGEKAVDIANRVIGKKL